MGFSEIIEDIQRSLLALQQRLDELKSMDTYMMHDILLTRQEAAGLIGKSLRQLDRDCIRHNIRKEEVNGGIRICKSVLLRYMGITGELDLQDRKVSDFTRIYNRHRR